MVDSAAPALLLMLASDDTSASSTAGGFSPAGAMDHIEMAGTPDHSRPVMAKFLGLARTWGGDHPQGVDVDDEQAASPPVPPESSGAGPSISVTGGTDYF
jgi:hypothetical protein